MGGLTIAPCRHAPSLNWRMTAWRPQETMSTASAPGTRSMLFYAGEAAVVALAEAHGIDTKKSHVLKATAASQLHQKGVLGNSGGSSLRSGLSPFAADHRATQYSSLSKPEHVGMGAASLTTRNIEQASDGANRTAFEPRAGKGHWASARGA